MNLFVYAIVLVLLVASIPAVALTGYDPRCQISQEELIARTLYAEAGDQGSNGLTAVATVIYNRKTALDADWRDIILAKKQFSCWNDPQALNTLPIGLEATFCRKLARGLITERFEPIGPWTHFYNPKLASPSWAEDLTEVRSIGGHCFGVLK